MAELYKFLQQPDADDAFVKGVANQLHAPAAVLVALSGGADSTALLASLAALGNANDQNIRVIACHVNHGLRGAESDDDERFCVELCRHLKVPLSVVRLSGEVADEARLREARYAALLECAIGAEAQYLATAHNHDDQVETVLFRIFRGTAPAGLAGIPAARKLSDVMLIRPLLQFSRSQIEEFLTRWQLPFREDSSNITTLYTRNYIRHEVVPRIKARFPTLPQSVERLRVLADEDEQLLAELANEASVTVSIDEDTLSRARFLTEPLSLQRRILAQCLRERGIEVTFDRTAEIVALARTGNGALSLDESIEVRINEDEIRFSLRADQMNEQPVSELFHTEIALSGLTLVPQLNLGVHVEALQQTQGPQRFPGSADDEVLADLSAVVLPLVVRTRQPGDIIQPFGMREKVKLKKYLHTHKKDSWINPRRHIVVADRDEILWVPGIGISEKIRVNAAPTHKLRFVRLEPDDVALC